jgi:hypothetical protein
MALYGETLETRSKRYCEGGSGEPDDMPPHPRQDLELEVLFSAAGFYIGSQCPFCGPFTRDSDYFASRSEAEVALASLNFGRKFVWQDGPPVPGDDR